MSSSGRPGRGLCLVVSAPSGAGKSTVLRALLQRDPDVMLSVSATTRAPRAGEEEGRHYFFTDAPGFAAMVEAGAMLEWATVFGRSYGTPRAPVVAALEAGRDVAFDIDWQGHRLLRAALPGDVVSVFIEPPSMDALRERLRGRGDDAAEVERRMAEAEAEWSHRGEFDHVVVNGALDRAVGELHGILRAARAGRGVGRG